MKITKILFAGTMLLAACTQAPQPLPEKLTSYVNPLGRSRTRICWSTRSIWNGTTWSHKRNNHLGLVLGIPSG